MFFLNIWNIIDKTVSKQKEERGNFFPLLLLEKNDFCTVQMIKRQLFLRDDIEFFFLLLSLF